MSFDLFNTTESLSPRLQWMRKHGIQSKQRDDSGTVWLAYKSGTSKAATGDDELDAIINLASKLNLKLWNQ